MNSKIFKRTLLIIALSATNLAVAQGQPTEAMVMGKLPELLVPNYSNSDLTNAGCDTDVWNSMVQNYINKRTPERIQQGQMQVRDMLAATPPPPGTKLGADGKPIPGGRSCFEGALSQVNGALKGIENLINIFTGTPNFEALAGMVGNAVCNQVDAYTSGIAYSTVTKPITNQVYGIGGAVTGQSINVPGVGNVGSSGQIINKGNSSLGQINQNSVGGALGGTTSTPWYQQAIQKANPFGPANSTTPLK